MFKFFILIVALTILSFVDCGFFKKNERIVANIDHFASCGSPQDNKLQLYLTTSKFNRTHTGVNMNITVPDSFGPEYALDLELRVWGDGGWKRNFFHYRKDDACNTLYLLLGQTWTEIIHAAKANSGCPVKPGYYTFDNFYIDPIKVPIFTSPGKILMVVIVLKHKVMYLCLEVHIDINVKVV